MHRLAHGERVHEDRKRCGENAAGGRARFPQPVNRALSIPAAINPLLTFRLRDYPAQATKAN